MGRALRRQSYDLDEGGRFNVEYADVLGIPFDFTAKPVVVPPQPPRKTVHVKAVTPERDACEIRFPRVEGYRVELPEERLSARFDADATLELTPDLVGPSRTLNQGIIGEGVDLNLVHTRALRRSTLLFHLAKRLLETKWRDPGEAPKLHLFGQLKRITRQWLDGHLVCKGGTYPAQLMYQELADVACERITRGIVAKHEGERPVRAVLDPYNPAGSTVHVSFRTSKALRWETAAGRSHVNWALCDSGWEAEFCRVAEGHPRVRAYVKNDNLGFEAPYRFGSEARRYRPDFIVVVDDGRERGRPAASGGGGQGLPSRGREGEEGGDGDLLGARGEPPGHVRPLGLRRVQGRVRDGGGFRGRGGSGVRRDDRRGPGVTGRGGGRTAGDATDHGREACTWTTRTRRVLPACRETRCFPVIR